MQPSTVPLEFDSGSKFGGLAVRLKLKMPPLTGVSCARARGRPPKRAGEGGAGGQQAHAAQELLAGQTARCRHVVKIEVVHDFLRFGRAVRIRTRVGVGRR